MLKVMSALQPREKAHRSVIKAVTNRLTSMISDMTVVSLITGQANETLQIVVLTNTSSTILFFFHERLWNRIEWGRSVTNPVKHKIHETGSRSLVKAITYRSFGLLLDSAVVNLITHSAPQTLVIVVTTNVMSTLIYLIHERVWNKIHWGKHVHHKEA